MKVLLTGGSGFVGSFIGRELFAQGHEVRALVRSGVCPPLLRGKADVIRGDILAPDSIDRAMDGVDAVIHSAARVSMRTIDRAETFHTNVDGTRNVLERAQRHGVRRVVYTSSVASMGATKTPEVLDETAPWGQAATGSPYHLSKWEAEQIALDLARRGLPVIILNPGVVLGPDDLNLTSSRLVMHAVNGTIPGHVEGGFSIVHVRDCARAHVAALERGKVGERYIVAGTDVTTSEFFARVAALTGVKAPRKLPRHLLFALIATFDGLVALVPPLGKTTLGELNLPTFRASLQYTFYDCKKAEDALGYTKTPLDETLKETIASLLLRGAVKARTPELVALLDAAKRSAVQNS
jgi:dihydroflavonol-4-reductase